MKRLSATLLIFILIAIFTSAQTMAGISVPYSDVSSPKREVRAVWLTTIGGLDWPHSYAQATPVSIERQQDELRRILDQLLSSGVNTVLLQTRVRATTIYPSKYEPWDGCLSGKPGVSPGYDALQFAIDECHKRGMELHAWVVTIPVGKWNGKGCSSLRKKYPKLIRKIGEDGYMNPEMPETGTIIADMCEEITRNYDVDGIHLDYIRYPEDWSLKVSREKGRGYISDIVRKIHNKVKALKPWVKLSCSPIGKADDLPRKHSNGWNAYSRVCQDAQGWLRDGLMDELYPMMYFRDSNFYPFALDWKQRSYGRTIVPGLGIYFLSPREKNWSLTDITREMEVCRQWGMGHCYFRSRFFTDNVKGIYDFAREFDSSLALHPAMTWESSTPPDAPTHLEVDSLASTITWGGAEDHSGAPYLLYNIYSSRVCPVDITDGRNLVAARRTDTSLLVPLKGQYYAVTAMDRYGNESAPLQSHVEKTPRKYREQHFSDGLPLFPCDGQTLYIGRTEANRSCIFNIETLQGSVVKTIFLAEKINIGDLPAGFYQVRCLGKKKSDHKLGYFMIERR